MEKRLLKDAEKMLDGYVASYREALLYYAAATAALHKNPDRIHKYHIEQAKEVFDEYTARGWLYRNPPPKNSATA